MAPRSSLLLNVLLVVGANVLYDVLRGEPAYWTTPAEHEPADEALRQAPAAPGGGLQLRGGAADRRVEQRLDGLEAAIRRLEGLGGDMRPARGGEEAPAAAGEGTDAAERVAPPDFGAWHVADPPQGGFDEPTLKTMAAYLGEIERRGTLEQKRKRIRAELASVDVRLDEVLAERVVRAALAYEERARAIHEDGSFARDEAGNRDRLAALRALADAYGEAIQGILPREDAAQVLSSGLGRGMAHFGGLGGGVLGQSGRRGRLPR